MWNPFKRKDIFIENKKSNEYVTWPWLVSTYGSDVNSSITIKRALQYYDEVAPVSTAVDWINDEFKTLSLVLKNNGESEDNPEILKFLRAPNDDMTQEDFLETLGAYYLITNEVYIIATGRPDKPPAELMVVSPEFVTVRKGADGYASQMLLKVSGMEQIKFTRDASSYRFYNNDKSAEIWQIKGFSPVSDSSYGSYVEGTNNITNIRGRSKLSSINKEINQYIEVAVSNLATLANGMKPSGTLTLPEGFALTDDQFNRLKKQVDSFYAGGKNSGKVLILDNGMTFTPANMTAKDMDFKELAKSITITIFNRYKVPLPLISPDNMTLANMGTAKLNLYDNCVLPMAARLLRELTNFLAPRFKLTEDMIIQADIGNISALQIRHFEQLKLKKELDIYTKNELREEVSLEDHDGGDTLYISNNLIAIGTGLLPEDDNNTSTDEMKATRPEFLKLMQAQTDKKGNRLLTDDEILQIADAEGL